MSNEKFKRYLVDTITLLKEQAREAKKDTENPKSGFEDYNEGTIITYCIVISLLKQQAFAFNIDEEELGLADIDPEQDLLGLRKRTAVDPD